MIAAFAITLSYSASAHECARSKSKEISTSRADSHNEHAHRPRSAPIAPYTPSSPFIAESGSPHPVSDKQEDSAPQKVANDPKYTGSLAESQKKLEIDWGLVANWVSAIFTAIAAISAGRAATVAAGANSISRENAKKELRAYVTVRHGASINQCKKRRLKFEFRPIIVNVGQTPAKEVEIVSNMVVTDKHITEDFDFNIMQSPHKSVVTLGAQQDRFTVIIAQRFFTLSELKAIRNGLALMYVYGSVSYKDIFDERRFTNYCFLINFGLRRNPTWYSAQYHNDSD